MREDGRGRLQRGAKAFQAARLVAKAIQARLHPHQSAEHDGQDATSPRRRSTRSAATTRRSRSTTRRPTGTRSTHERTPRAKTPTRLSPTPTLLRLGLGQEDEAIKDGDAYNRTFGNTKPAHDRGDRVRHRRSLRRARELGQGASQALSSADGAHREERHVRRRRPGARSARAHAGRT